MPRLVRHPRPLQWSAGSSGGGRGGLLNSIYANRGPDVTGEMQREGLRMLPQAVSHIFQGLAAQRQAKERTAHAEAFLDDLHKTNPEWFRDPAIAPFLAGVAHGVIEPRHAIAGVESVLKDRTAQTNKAAITDKTEQGKNTRLDTTEHGKTERLNTVEHGKDVRFSEGESGKNQRLDTTEQGKNTRLDTTEHGRDRRFDAGEAGKNDRFGQGLGEKVREYDLTRGDKNEQNKAKNDQADRGLGIRQQGVDQQGKNIDSLIQTRGAKGTKPTDMVSPKERAAALNKAIENGNATEIQKQRAALRAGGFNDKGENPQALQDIEERKNTGLWPLQKNVRGLDLPSTQGSPASPPTQVQRPAPNPTQPDSQSQRPTAYPDPANPENWKAFAQAAGAQRKKNDEAQSELDYVTAYPRGATADAYRAAHPDSQFAKDYKSATEANQHATPAPQQAAPILTPPVPQAAAPQVDIPALMLKHMAANPRGEHEDEAAWHQRLDASFNPTP